MKKKKKIIMKMKIMVTLEMKMERVPTTQIKRIQETSRSSSIGQTKLKPRNSRMIEQQKPVVRKKEKRKTKKMKMMMSDEIIEFKSK